MNIKLKLGKSKTGNPYFSLVVDLGYRCVPLTFKSQDIAEILGISVREMYDTYKLTADETVKYFDV